MHQVVDGVENVLAVGFREVVAIGAVRGPVRFAGQGAGLDDVVRTRMFVTNIDQWAEIGRAHREAFAGIAPATSMVEVSRLIDPDMLVEIEADAILSAD